MGNWNCFNSIPLETKKYPPNQKQLNSNPIIHVWVSNSRWSPFPLVFGLNSSAFWLIPIQMTEWEQLNFLSFSFCSNVSFCFSFVFVPRNLVLERKNCVHLFPLVFFYPELISWFLFSLLVFLRFISFIVFPEFFSKFCKARGWFGSQNFQRVEQLGLVLKDLLPEFGKGLVDVVLQNWLRRRQQIQNQMLDFP